VSAPKKRAICGSSIASEADTRGGPIPFRAEEQRSPNVGISKRDAHRRDSSRRATGRLLVSLRSRCSRQKNPRALLFQSCCSSPSRLARRGFSILEWQKRRGTVLMSFSATYIGGNARGRGIMRHLIRNATRADAECRHLSALVYTTFNQSPEVSTIHPHSAVTPRRIESRSKVKR